MLFTSCYKKIENVFRKLTLLMSKSVLSYFCCFFQEITHRNIAEFRGTKMNKKNLICAIGALMATMFAGNTVAATDNAVAGGVITFSGAVSDTTCDVTTNNGSDFTVDVSPVTRDALGTAVGVVSASATPFTINVSGCTGFDNTSAAAQALNIVFTGSNVSDDMNYLKNESGSAEGVGIAITSDGSTLLKMNKAIDTGLKTTKFTTTGSFDTGAQGNMTFYANYYNYGGIGAKTGSVVSTATYTFSYE
ncbi:fimbrial protein [Erwinia papayae]